MITRAGLESCGAELISAGTVVMSSRAPIGHLALVTREVCTNQGCKSFVPGPAIDPLFLFFALKLVVPELRRLGSGATFAEVSKTQLEKFSISYPCLNEQRRIALALRDQLKEVARARAAAEARLEAARALLHSVLERHFSEVTTKGWAQRPMGHILNLRKDVVHPRDRPSGAASFVGLEHIESGSGVRVGSVKIDKSALTGRKPAFLTGDIVYGYLRPYLNKVWVAEFDGLCSVDQYVYAVNPGDAFNRYVAWFMRSPLFLARAPISTAPGQLPRIRTDEVAKVEIELPTLPEQEASVANLEATLEQVRRASEASRSEVGLTAALPAALLRRAFRGKL